MSGSESSSSSSATTGAVSTTIATTDGPPTSSTAKRLATSSIFMVPAQSATTQVKKICTIAGSTSTANTTTSKSMVAQPTWSSSSSTSSPPQQATRLINILSLNSSPDQTTSGKLQQQPIKYIASSNGVSGSDSPLSTSPIKITSVVSSSSSLSTSPNTTTTTTGAGGSSKVIKISSNGTTSTINLSATTPTKISPVNNNNGGGSSPSSSSSLLRNNNNAPSTSILNAKILTLPAGNNNSNASGGGQNKIQYVKIVNTPLGSVSSTTNTGSTSSSSAPIKITTLTGKNTQDGIKPTFLTSSINQQLASQTSDKESSSSDHSPSISDVKQPSYFQLVGNGPVNATNNSTSSNRAAPAIQRVQSVNYKILTQQLPPQAPPPSTSATSHQQGSIVIRPPSSTITTIKSNIVSSSTTNPIVITKTVNNSNSDHHQSSLLNSDFTVAPVKRQIITTIRSGGGEGSKFINSSSSSTNLSQNPFGTTTTTTNSVTKKTVNNFPAFNSAPSYPASFLASAADLAVAADKPTTLKQNIKSVSNTNGGGTAAHAAVINTSISNSSSSLNTTTLSTSNAAQHQSSSLSSSSNSSQNRKPCNCTKSMCLKLYCDCFALGSFCHDCNCVNCFNNLDHEEERTKAIKLILERNPQAFQSKIGKFTAQLAYNNKMIPPNGSVSAMQIDENSMPLAATDEVDEHQQQQQQLLPASRHMKGCNCKKSNCLKRYCECFLAKIQCSTLCKCVGCKNCDESTRTLLQLANAADIRKQQQQQQSQLHQSNLMNQSSFLANTSGSLSTSFLNTPTTSSLFLMPFDKSEFLTELQQKQRDDKELLGREYVNAFEDKIESSCGRMIQAASQEIANILTSEQMDDDDDENENRQDLDWNQHGSRLEKLILDEFGQCLSEIIQTAEQTQNQ